MRLCWLAVFFSLALSHSVIAAASLPELLARYQSEPRNALLCEQIGVEYARSSRFVEAADFFQRAVDLDPGRVSAEKNLGTVLWFSGNKSKSENIFRSLEKRIPNDPVPQLYLGLAAYDRKQYASAAAHFDRAGPLASDNPELFPTLIATYLSTRQFARVSKLLENRVASGHATAQMYRWLAEAYDGQQLPQKSYDSYAVAIRLEPDAKENYLALAGFSIEHGNLTFAEEILQRGLLRLPHSPELLLEAGLVSALAGKFEDSRKSILAATAADPRSSAPTLALGVLDLQRGDAKSAAEHFQRAKDLAPDDYRGYYLHALALSRSASNKDTVLRADITAELRHALRLNARQPEAYVLLAETELADGRSETASKHFEKALLIDPNDPAALYKYALLCRRLGRTEEASRLFRAFEQRKQKLQADENGIVLILKTLK